MEDRDLLIYFLFLAISLLGGVWKKFKKRQNAETPEPIDVEQEEVLELDTLEQLFEKQKIEKEERAEKAAFIASSTPPSKPIDKPKATKSKRSPRKVNEVLIETDEEGVEFDLRSAVIQSEILNPPYL